jgi:transglutaminase-like putative cysteine protease
MIVQLSANETTKDSIQPKILRWDWTAATLLLGCVLLASGRLVVTEASDHLILIAFLAILGCLAGMTVGHSRFSGSASALLAFFYGAFFVPWQLGLAFIVDQAWSARLRDLAGRLAFAIEQFAGGKNVEDPLLFVTVMAILFWIIGFNSGYRLFRRGDLWGALIPFGIALLIVQTYDFGQTWKGWFLALFLLCLLLLLARLQFIKQRQGWENSRIYIPFELSGSLGGLAFTSAALLVLFAWVTPALASSLDTAESFWSTVTSPWRAVRDELNRALFSLRGEPTRVGNVFGERFLLGRGIPQSPVVLFTVQIIHQDQTPLRYYWRDRVYDHYENGNWSSSYEGLEVWDDATADSLSDLQGRTNTQLLFTAQDSIVLLHAAAQPIALNRAAQFSFAANEDGTEDIAALFAASPVLAGESYDTTASIAVPTANQLRDAGLDYPAWITERYLQLPVDFSPRIAKLAQTLTEDLSTPYDKTIAITNYLRGELEYVDRMPLAPFDLDPIEWALFDKKQGFCNYYASAEVLMLRSLGIPARLAVGYAQGERENVGGRTQYTVRLRDAHAWPEVYFPGIGWVESEPTANQDPLIRPTNTVEGISLEEELRLLREERSNETSAPESQQPEVTTSEEFRAQEEARNFLPSMIFLAAVLSLLAVFLFRRYRAEGGLALPVLIERGFARLDVQPPRSLRQMARLAELPVLTRAYMQINLALDWLGLPPKFGDTPEQRATVLAERLPNLSDEIHALSRDHQSRVYSESKVAREERSTQTMRRIRWAARREQLFSWLRRIRR